MISIYELQELPLLGALWFRLILERLFTLHCIPWHVGEDWGGVYHPYQPEDQWAGHSYGDPNYRWGRGRKLGYGDHLLLPWSSQNPTLSALHTTCQSQAWWWWEDTPTLPIFLEGLPISSIWMWALSPGALPPPNSHWTTGCIYAGYSLSLGLRCSYLMKRGQWGWKCTPFPKRFCGRVQKRNTASLTWFCCWSLISPSSMSRRGHPDREGQAFTQPSSFYRMPIKPELNWNVSWSRRHRSWLKDMTIRGSNRPGGTERCGHGWWSRQMPPFMRYFPRWVWQIPSSYCPWCISAAVPLCYMSGMMATAMQQDKDIPAVSEPKGSLAPGLSGSPVHPPGTPPLPVPPLPDIPLGRHSPSGAPICWVPSHLHTEKVRLLSQQFTWPSSQQEDPCQLPRGQN